MEKKKLIAGGGLVQNEKGELLMIYRRGKWDLPKGKQDEGEAIEVCALREVMEETGLVDIEIGRLIEVSYHEYFDEYLKQDVLKETYWFAMTANSNEALIPQAAEGITEIRWVDNNELEKYLADSYANVVAVIRKR